jgi:hypothetical protein
MTAKNMSHVRHKWHSHNWNSLDAKDIFYYVNSKERDNRLDMDGNLLLKVRKQERGTFIFD